MAAPRRSLSLRNTGSPLVAAARPSPSPGPRGTSEPEFDSDSQLDGDTEELERSSCLSVSSDEEQGASAPWPSEPGERSAPAALLERCVAAGAVSQVPPGAAAQRRSPQLGRSAERGRTTALNYCEPYGLYYTSICPIKLKTEMMQLENETADITHHFYLGKKCEILQDMKRHLEAVLKEKRHLRKRLIKHRCQESLPIEATYHKSIVELLAEAVTFIEKLESHLQSVRSIPQIPHMMSNMDTTLSKTEVLMIELAELREQILKWEELQKEVYSNNVCNTADLDFGLSLT
ncbi:HAUS augmin-like complex subunit 2 isoform X1 [Onychostruthus taczanowskii]|uniref:HAUS augmin-like complex subunit 2 isoform X1 n=1 Tax=Onychostruthus taczanowskii TaxID=356909 RepID=UPI001B800351|nr:HAUS augmin-like complex subunit 2 isoform X1 [Onychostruthus taczanowskii]